MIDIFEDTELTRVDSFLLIVRFARFHIFRQKTIDVIIHLVEYTNKFATYNNAEHVSDLLDEFARHLFLWRRPYPKFGQEQASDMSDTQHSWS